MMTKTLVRTLTLVGVIGGLAVAPAWAGDGTWLGISGNWSAPATWSGGIVADGADFTANFTGVNITANQTVSVDLPRTIGNITFTDATTASHDLTLSGPSALTLDVTSGNPDVNVTQSGRTLTITAPIAGSDGLKKSGPGQLVPSANNTFSGGINLAAGTIQVFDNANEQAFLGSPANVLTFTGNATLYNLNNQVTLPQGITVNGGVTATLLGAFGEVTDMSGVLAGSGTLLVDGASANWYFKALNTANTFTGKIQIRGGAGHATLGVRSLADGANPIELGRPANANGPGRLEYMSGATSPLVLNDRQFVLTDNYISVGDRISGILNNAAGANTVTVNKPLSVTSTGSAFFQLGGSNAGNNTFAGAIPDVAGAGVLSLYKQNSGKWILAGVNTYAGNTTIVDGTLELGGAGQLGGGTYAGAISIGAGDAFIVNSTADQTLNGAITGSGGTPALTKSNTGTLVLNGANTYTGSTAINGGTLRVDGSTVGSAHTVNSGGTLAGEGTIGNVTVNSGGTLAPSSGSSASALHTKNLALASGATCQIDINAAATDADQIDVVGSVNLGSATLAFGTTPTTVAQNTLLIINNDGTDPVVGTFNGLPDGTVIAAGSPMLYAINYAGGDGNDVVLVSQYCTSFDSVPPSIVACPADISVANDPGACGAKVTWTIEAEDTCDEEPIVVCSPNTDNLFPVGTTRVECTAVDNYNNRSPVCAFDVTVTDHEEPVLAAADVVFGTDAGACGSDENVAVSASDNCEVQSLVCDRDLTAPWPVGVTPVNCTATDIHGNQASASFTVTVTDTEQPQITVPADFVQNCAPATGLPVWYDASASDNCGVALFECVPASGSMFPVGVTAVICSAIDANGNVAGAGFSVTITEDPGPQIVCPADILVDNDAGACGAMVSYDMPIATGDCADNAIVVCDPPSGFFPVGETLVECIATDPDLTSVAECSFHVTVVDTEAPAIACPPDVLVASGVGLDIGQAGASDNCGVTVSNDAPDEFIQGTTTVVTWTATDPSGNTASCQQVVTVIDTEPPVITNPGNQAYVVACGGTASYTEATATDNVGATVVCTPANPVGVGVTEVTCTATDAAGNSASAAFTVTVVEQVGVVFQPPLAGQPVANKVKYGSKLPHKVKVTDCSGSLVTSGITVRLGVVGKATGLAGADQEIAEDATGVGVDAISPNNDGIMVLTDGQWHFNLNTGCLTEPNTLSDGIGGKHYQSTVTVYDNVTGLLIGGPSTVNLETKP